MAFCNVGVSKQKGSSVGSASGHNDRAREVPNADPERTHLNRVLVGDDRNAREIVRQIIREHGGKPRRDSVEAVELLLSAAHEWFLDADGEISQEKVDQFYEQSLKFLRDRKNCGVCAKAVLHMDERTPHIHAHMVPITEEGRLSATHFLDGRKKMKQLHTRHAAYMEPIGLERGREGSRATHQRLKLFYASVTKEPELKIDPDRIPDPSRLKLLTADGARAYKLEVLGHVLEQVKEPVRVLQDQAQLTRDEHAHRVEAEKRAEAAERRAAERVAEAELEAREKITEVREQEQARFENLRRSALALYEENKELRGEKDALLQSRNEYYEKFVSEQLRGQQARARAGALGARLMDIPLLDVMEKMGYGRGEEQGQGPEALNVYRTRDGGVGLIVRGQEAFDGRREPVCRDSVSLVLHMMNEHRGEDMTREDAVTWLGENFGRGRASAAYLVEREHSVQGLFERAFGRGEPGHDRGGQDRVGTDRGGGGPSFGGR